MNVQHQTEQDRFVIEHDGHIAELVYRRPAPDQIDFLHTGVPEVIGGQGIAAQLVRAGLTFAREHQLRVRPYCSYVHNYMRQHAEYQDLVADDFAL